MLSIISLFLILVENSISFNGIIVCTALPFISYTIRRGGNFLFLLLTYIMMSVQTDKYLYIFLVILMYIILNQILLAQMEYNRKTIFYLLILQIFFYWALSYKVFSIEYLIINILGFLFWDYIYAKTIEIKGK